MITSLPTFQHRFGSHTTVRYHADTVAASEPHAVDIVNTSQDPRDVELRTQRHLDLLKVRIKKGQLATSPSFGKQALKFMASDHDIRAIKECLSAKRKRSRLRTKALLQKAQDAKVLAATRKRLQENKARHRTRVAAAKRNKSEVGSGSDSSSRAASPSVKKQKTGATEVRAIPTNKGKGKVVAVEGGSDDELSGFPDFDDDVYQQMDAAATDESGSESEEPVSDEMRVIMETLQEIDILIEERTTSLESRRPEDMWEEFGAIPPGMEAGFQAEIEKRLRVQQEWEKEQHISEEAVDIKAFILSLSLKDFQ